MCFPLALEALGKAFMLIFNFLACLKAFSAKCPFLPSWVVVVLMTRKWSLSRYCSSLSLLVTLPYRNAAGRALADDVLSLQQKSYKGWSTLNLSKYGKCGLKYHCRQYKLSCQIKVTASFWSLSWAANFVVRIKSAVQIREVSARQKTMFFYIKL